MGLLLTMSSLKSLKRVMHKLIATGMGTPPIWIMQMDVSALVMMIGMLRQIVGQSERAMPLQTVAETESRSMTMQQMGANACAILNIKATHASNPDLVM